MVTDRLTTESPLCTKPWWREAGAVGLFLLVIVAYYLRAGELPLRGEEPTRAQIALEMVERGDWLVPREQGEAFRIRPPLQTWLIAINCATLGSWDPWTVRLSSLLATLFTTLLIYGYSRTFLTSTGALAAGAAFATLADIFQMGRQAETEALFIFLLSASLLVWHWGIVGGWSDAVTWIAGYTLMVLAMLTKGLQAPTYFLGSTGLYLILTGSWRRLFSKGHLLGGLVGAALLCSWVIPYYRVLGWSGVKDAWMGDPILRFNAWYARYVVPHLFTYPLEIAAGTLPWSILLLLYCRRDFRQTIGTARPQVLFLSICLAVAAPVCWIWPLSQPRFFAPLFPCLAVLIGLAIQRCAEAEISSPLRTAWSRYLATVACVAIGAAAATVVAACFFANHPKLAPWAEPLPIALAFAVGALGMAVLLWRVRAGGTPARVQLGILGVACFLVMTFSGVLTDVRVRRSENTTEAMRLLKEKLPPGQQLVSLDGHTDSLFAYLYGKPFIRPENGPTATLPPGADWVYFCFISPGDSRRPLPFRWEEIGAVSLDRNHHEIPERVAVVGRRLLDVLSPRQVHVQGVSFQRIPAATEGGTR